MATILTIRKTGLGNFPRGASCELDRKKPAKRPRVLCVNKKTVGRRESAVAAPKERDAKLGLAGAVAILASVVATCGAIYLYQANALVSKGYEIQRLQSRIADLEKTNQSGSIQETELRSMYNIEKATQKLDLVSSQDVTYLELKGPMAMK